MIRKPGRDVPAPCVDKRSQQCHPFTSLFVHLHPLHRRSRAHTTAESRSVKRVLDQAATLFVNDSTRQGAQGIITSHHINHYQHCNTRHQRAVEIKSLSISCHSTCVPESSSHMPMANSTDCLSISIPFSTPSLRKRLAKSAKSTVSSFLSSQLNSI